MYKAFNGAPARDYVTAALDAAFIRVEVDLVYTTFKVRIYGRDYKNWHGRQEARELPEKAI